MAKVTGPGQEAANGCGPKKPVRKGMLAWMES